MKKELTPEEKSNKRIGIIALGVIILCAIFFGKGASSNSSSSSSSSSNTHKCSYCGQNYSGIGWMTIDGEQYQPDKDPGYDIYCSKKCAYDAQPARWK